jgi:hypothetical protein
MSACSGDITTTDCPMVMHPRLAIASATQSKIDSGVLPPWFSTLQKPEPANTVAVEMSSP